MPHARTAPAGWWREDLGKAAAAVVNVLRHGVRRVTAGHWRPPSGWGGTGVYGRLGPMKPLPLPLRVAAGLAVTTAERVRELPRYVIGLPVTVASQILQLSMRVQQHVTELAIKGDDVLSSLRPVEDTPSWATFDEDDEDVEPDFTGLGSSPEPAAESVGAGGRGSAQAESSGDHNGHVRPAEAVEAGLAGPGDPWEQEERALAEDHADGEFDSAAVAEALRATGPAGLDAYDEMTLPQLRARLRRFTLVELEELLAYERGRENRASFVGMLTRRIGNVQKTSENITDTGGAGTEDR
jgi:hypothetical protein